MLKTTMTVITAGAAILATGLWAQEETPDHRLRSAASVLRETMNAPDRGIPRDLLEKAQCVVIVPGLKKAAFVVGGDYGRGYAVCRHGAEWTGPAAIKFGGGSFGPQIGVESTDIIMLVMDRKGAENLMRDKFTIGADASAAAGPVGRTTSADTDASLHAEILTWSRAHGVFAGVSLDGTVVSKDGGEDRKIYGSEVENRAILHGDVPPPAVAGVLTSVLAQYPKVRG
jgi:lipid-binding SYLF domain-containing protein